MRVRVPVSAKTRFIVMVVAIAFYAIAYEVTAQLTDNPAVPSFSEMLAGLIHVVTPQGYEKKIWLLTDVRATYGRLFFGMGVGCVVGVVLGILMGCYDVIESFLYPVLAFFSYAPSTAMVAVLCVYLSTSEMLFVVLLCLSAAPALACKLSVAIRNDATTQLVNKTYTLGAKHIEVVWNFILRQVLPKIIDNVRLHMGAAMVAIIGAELLVGSEGFGYRIRLMGRQPRWDIVYVYLIVLATSGFFFEEGLVKLRRFVCSWFDKKYK